MNTEHRGLRFVAGCSLFVAQQTNLHMKQIPFLIVALVFAACTDRKSEIEKAMRQHDQLTFRMNADSLADSYLSNGVLSGKGMKRFVGRDSIRKFLKSFNPTGIHLISNSTKVQSITF